jgi:hypothetical protein
MSEFYLLKTDDIKKRVAGEISTIDVHGKLMSVTIAEYSETRSQKQNRYLWGWIYANIVRLLNESGQTIKLKEGKDIEWTKDTIHEAFKVTFLALQPIETAKGEIKRYQSTASMKKVEFKTYLEDIDKACWSWFNITIPQPHGMFEHIYNDIK